MTYDYAWGVGDVIIKEYKRSSAFPSRLMRFRRLPSESFLTKALRTRAIS